MAKLASNIHIKQGQQILIDGKPFPYHVSLEDIQIEAMDGGRMTKVWVPILVEYVEVQTRGKG